MDALNSDLILHIAQYGNVSDLASWMQSSKRYYYLIHHMRRVMGPEMVVSAAPEPVLEGLLGLRQSPTLALCCSTEQSDFNQRIARQLPPDCIVVGAVAQSIQTCKNGEVEASSPHNLLLGHLGSEASVQPFVLEANVGEEGMQWSGALENEVKETFKPDNEGGSNTNANNYEVFIIYGCGSGCGVLEEFIQCVQSLHPQAALVGGICSSGFCSKPVHPKQMDKGVLSSKRVGVLKKMYLEMGGSPSVLETLTEKQTLVEKIHELLQKHPFVVDPCLEDAVFGVALRGNVPIRSAVSRGVKNLTPPDTTLVVHESRLLGPTISHEFQQQQDGEEPLSRTVIPAFHVIDSLVEKRSDAPWDFMSFLARHGGEGVDFCGIRRRKPGASMSDDESSYEETFELYALDMHGEKLKIPINNSDLFSSRAVTLAQVAENQLAAVNGSGIANTANQSDLEQAQVGFFALDGEACMDHVKSSMKKLREQTDTNGENVLAAMMFSCAGRGPMPGWLLTEPMADATAFAVAFGKQVPCIGFYAGGEIGPLATAPVHGIQESDLFQRGRAALQGFTAVFALFIAPTVDLRHMDIDDSPIHVDEFIGEHLRRQ